MCTIVKFDGENGFLLGKNNDSFFDDGILYTNKRGIRKRALITPPGIPLNWVSRHGSVSFSQCGKELPVGGMNEAGLIVEQATLPETIYPESHGLQGVGELQLIQVLLDTCATVDEAIKMVQQVEICRATWTIHYVLADRSGEMAILEYLNGEIVVHCGDCLPIKALTNSRYSKSLSFSSQIRTGLILEDQYEQDSLERFCKAEDLLVHSYDISSAFVALEKLERTDTVWNLVYHPEESKVSFRKKGDGVNTLDLRRIDFQENAQALMLPLSNPCDGRINSGLMQYSRERNTDLVSKFFKNEVMVSVMNLNVPDELLSYLALYPEILDGLTPPES